MTPEAALEALAARAEPGRAAQMAAYHKVPRRYLGLANAETGALATAWVYRTGHTGAESVWEGEGGEGGGEGTTVGADNDRDGDQPAATVDHDSDGD